MKTKLYDVHEIPDAKKGEWEVCTEVVSEEDAKASAMRAAFQGGRGAVQPGPIKMLKRHGQIIMSDTPDERADHLMFVLNAKGRVLINGLGLGVCLADVLNEEGVDTVTVVEKSKEVLDLVGWYFEKDSRVGLVHGDAFEYQPTKGVKFDAVWHDIWDTICEENLPEMAKLHRKYGRKTKWQGSWCKKRCQQMKKETMSWF